MATTPRNLMRQSCTILTRVESTAANGAKMITWSASGATVTPCALQPARSQDALLMSRELGTVVYEMFCGADAASITHEMQVEVGGIRYFVMGNAIDLCSNGSVYQVNLTRNT